MDTPSLNNDSEVNSASRTLSKLSPGYLPRPIFYEIARLVVTPIVELIPLRRRHNDIEVLLIPRPDDDPFWPEQLHAPGTVLRSTDIKDSFDTAIKRIMTDELHITNNLLAQYVCDDFHQGNRGVELARVYYIDCSTISIDVGTWYPADKLPDNSVREQHTYIAKSVDHLLSNSTPR